MPTTGVSGVVSEFGPTGAPPNGTTESAAGVAAAATTTGPDLFLEERSVTAPPELVRPWAPEMVIPARTNTATATGNPTIHNARELPMCRMACTLPALTSGNLLEKGVINSPTPT
jgi:hypothetical protein